MKYIFYILFLCSNSLFAQKIIRDTILVNENRKSVLSIKGNALQIDKSENSNFKIVDNPIHINGNTIINLQANNKFENLSELTILSSDNIFYNLKVKYIENDFDPFFFLTEDKQQKKQKPKNNVEKVFLAKETKKEEINIDDDSSVYMEDAKRINSSLKRDFHRTGTRQNGVSIVLVNSYARNNKLFLRFEFENRSSFPFLSDRIYFKITEEGSFGKKSSPEEMINSLYIYDSDTVTLKPTEKTYKTFVFDAFKVPENRMFKIYLLEKNSATEYALTFRGRYINEPKIFSYTEK